VILERAVGGGEFAVVGLGRSGVAATRLLRQGGIPVYASDRGDSRELAAYRDELIGLGASVELGRHDLPRISRAAACVVSPGIPSEAPPIAAAHDSGVPVVAEAALGLEAMPGVQYIAVTGTNGKSTTTAMIGHLLGHAGYRAIAAGNIGMPLSEVALEPIRPEWVSVELSSFQLHDMPDVRPAVGVLTNLEPDHLDRYPRLEDYYADKALLFRNADPESIWVVNADSPASLAMTRDVPGRRFQFSLQTPADGWLERSVGMLMLGSEGLMHRRDLPLLGEHNIANALAAALAVRAIGVELDAISEGFATFRGLPHRMEMVRELNRVLWINDSKATNLSSTAVAVTALDRPFVLLLGGRHKGAPYTSLVPSLKLKCRAVIAFGEAQPIIARDLADSGVPIELATTFDEVLQKARTLARPGEAVLLSPACSSYDMFHNYEERGARFRDLVQSW
jgi:UDP-N-acetylmuramoylalanine--D-glutamate ligase